MAFLYEFTVWAMEDGVIEVGAGYRWSGVAVDTIGGSVDTVRCAVDTVGGLLSSLSVFFAVGTIGVVESGKVGGDG